MLVHDKKHIAIAPQLVATQPTLGGGGAVAAIEKPKLHFLKKIVTRPAAAQLRCLAWWCREGTDSGNLHKEVLLAHSAKKTSSLKTGVL